MARSAGTDRARIGRPAQGREESMAVARVTKITASSSKGFDAAVQSGLKRASKTVRGITGLHIIDQKASIKNGKIDEYGGTMGLPFIREDWGRGPPDETPLVGARISPPLSDRSPGFFQQGRV